MLAPPQPKQFESKDQLMDYLQSHAGSEEFAVFIRRSSRGRQMLVQCDRSGSYDNRNKTSGSSTRDTSSRKIECPFSLYASVKKDGLWSFEVRNESHNHTGSSNLSVHPVHRQLPSENLSEVQRLSAAGIAPKGISAALRQADPESLYVNRDIYNAILKTTEADLRGRKPIEALLDTLAEKEYHYEYSLSRENEVTRLFFARQSAVQLTRRYPTVFVLDCTYKTNQSCLPLLHFVGTSSTNKGFSSCFAFLSRETEADYVWALRCFVSMLAESPAPEVIATDKDRALMNAIKHVLPTSKNLLCTWHINNNVATNCKKFFSTESEWESFFSTWSQLCESRTEEDFASIVSIRHTDLSPGMFQYLNDTWFSVKEMFVRAWTSSLRHYGNATTSRAEGAHAVLKRCITASTGDLFAAHKKIALAWEEQLVHVNHAVEVEKLRVGLAFRAPFFKNVAGKISTFTLNHIKEQLKKVAVLGYSSACTKSFRTTMGIPYSHLTKARQLSSSVLEMSDFDRQWWLSDDSPPQVNDHAIPNSIAQRLSDLVETVSVLPAHRQAVIVSEMERSTTTLTQLQNPATTQAKGRPLNSVALRWKSCWTEGNLRTWWQIGDCIVVPPRGGPLEPVDSLI